MVSKCYIKVNSSAYIIPTWIDTTREMARIVYNSPTSLVRLVIG
jgi:hypothetical protein